MAYIWDERKNQENQRKHGISFEEAVSAFEDPKRLILEDPDHSQTEKRLFCIGKLQQRVLTVRFTKRNGDIRMIGAGFWRKGRKLYEQKNEI